MSESLIENQLFRGVSDLGGIAYKWVSPGRRGVPDRILMFPGKRVYWVELKSPGMMPDPSQVREHARIRSMGHTVHVLDSSDAVSLFLSQVEKAMFRPNWAK